jgi:hypothetical protein
MAGERVSSARKGGRGKGRKTGGQEREKKGFYEQEPGASVRLKIGILCAPLLQQPEC